MQLIKLLNIIDYIKINKMKIIIIIQVIIIMNLIITTILVINNQKLIQKMNIQKIIYIVLH